MTTEANRAPTDDEIVAFLNDASPEIKDKCHAVLVALDADIAKRAKDKRELDIRIARAEAELTRLKRKTNKEIGVVSLPQEEVEKIKRVFERERAKLRGDVAFIERESK